MLFALFFDKVVWNSTPGLWGLLGCAMILGSALFVALTDQAKETVEVRGGSDEEVALMEGDSPVESLNLEVRAGESGRGIVVGDD